MVILTDDDGPIFRRTELTELEESSHRSVFPNIARHRFGVMQHCVNISGFTQKTNKRLQGKDMVSNDSTNLLDFQQNSSIQPERTAMIATEIKIIQQQVEQLRQALANGIVSTEGMTNLSPQPPKTKRSEQPPGRRKRIGSRDPGPVPIHAVAALLKQRIAEIRSDDQKLAEFSEQCSLYAERKAEKLKQEKKGTLDYVLFNKDPFILATYGSDEHIELIKQRSAERDVRSAAVRRANREVKTKNHIDHLTKLKIKQQRMARITGTLSRKQAVERTAARSWTDIMTKWKAANRMIQIIQQRRMEKKLLVTHRETAAVQVLESWWCGMKNGKKWCVSAIRINNLIAHRTNPWKERAKSKVLSKKYNLLIHFLKDLAASKRVVVAIAKLVKRTKMIQRWYRREIGVRRAKRRVWLLQWVKFEAFTRSSHDIRARRDIKKHRVGETMVHSSTKIRGKEANLVPRRANLDVAVYKRIVGAPTLSQEIREEAIFVEFMAASKRHLAKVIAWEAEVAEYQQALDVISVKKKQITLSGSSLDSALLDQLHLPTPPPPKPVMPLILSAPDLMKLIETTTKKAAADIALKVAQDLESEQLDTTLRSSVCF